MTLRSSLRCKLGPRRRNRRRWSACLAVSAMLATSALAGTQADAETDQDIIKDRNAKRQELQQAAADATDNLDAATAEADDLIEALNKAQAAVDAQQSAFDDAERAVAETEAVLQEAQAMIVDLQARMDLEEQRLHDAVIRSYVSFGTPSGSLNVLSADPWQHSRGEALAGFATGNHIDGIDQLRKWGEELENWRNISTEAAEQAAQHRQKMLSNLDDLHEALDREAQLATAAEDRVETRLYEVQALRALDAEYAAEIENAERRIAAALARQRAEEEARRVEAERASARARAIANSDLQLVKVQGIWVNAIIADDTRGLLDAMKAEGFELGGGGYRSHSAQIALRRAHCGNSDWAIWQARASSCRPPTARPGRSNHERGLAIDFTYQGRIISRRNTDVYRALERIAPQFGFKNLPSEPWHWDAV